MYQPKEFFIVATLIGHVIVQSGFALNADQFPDAKEVVEITGMSRRDREIEKARLCQTWKAIPGF